MDGKGNEVTEIPGAVHDLLDGLAAGATEAPGATYRLDARISDAFDGE